MSFKMSRSPSKWRLRRLKSNQVILLPMMVLVVLIYFICSFQTPQLKVHQRKLIENLSNESEQRVMDNTQQTVIKDQNVTKLNHNVSSADKDKNQYNLKNKLDTNLVESSLIPDQQRSKKSKRGFFGRTFDQGVIEQALKQMSQDREIIIQVIDFHLDDLYLRAEMQINALAQLQSFGYHHILLVALKEQQCRAIQRINPAVGCIYGSFRDVPQLAYGQVARALDNNTAEANKLQIWTIRYLVVFKAIQYGYNVLQLDSDVMITRDMYQIFKHKQFQEFQWIAGFDFTPQLNGGMQYIQNAKPNGPIAWSIFQVADLAFRWKEEKIINPLEFANSQYKSQLKYYFVDDQSQLSDGILSTIVGRPVFLHSLLHEYWELGQYYTLDVVKTWRDHVDVLWKANIRYYDMDISPFKKFIISRDPYKLYTYLPVTNKQKLEYWDLKLPWSYNQFPVEFGGKAYSSNRGSASKWLLKFAQENGRFDLWPDQDAKVHSFQEVQFRDSNMERIVHAPFWLMDLFEYHASSGMHQYFDNKPSACTICHFNGINQGSDQEGRKEYVKALGGWNYTAIANMHNGLLFRETTKAEPYPRVLALHPNIVLGARYQNETASLVDVLIKMSIVSNRRLVFPNIDCNSWFINKDIRSRHMLNGKDAVVFGEHKPECLWFGYMTSSCFKKGFSPMDFREYQRILTKELNENSLPSKDNTIEYSSIIIERSLKNNQVIKYSQQQFLEKMNRFQQNRLVYVHKLYDLTLTQEQQHQFDNYNINKCGKWDKQT